MSLIARHDNKPRMTATRSNQIQFNGFSSFGSCLGMSFFFTISKRGCLEPILISNYLFNMNRNSNYKSFHSCSQNLILSYYIHSLPSSLSSHSISHTLDLSFFSIIIVIDRHYLFVE